MRFIIIIALILFAVPAWAQSVSEINLRYQLGQALSAQALSEAKNVQGEADLKQAVGQRDWWIACAKDQGCLTWALGK